MDTTKAQMGIQAIGGIAIAILIAAVVLGLGGTILSSIQEGQTDSSATIINQTFTWPGNNTLVSFNADRVSTSSVVLYCNVSLLTVNQNYTVAANGIYITNQTTLENSSIQLCHYNMTYNYNYGSVAYNSSNEGMTGTNTLAEFIPTIAIVAIAGIVIGIILVFFRRKELIS